MPEPVQPWAKEPWFAKEHPDGSGGLIYVPHESGAIVLLAETLEGKDLARANRIIACVNACAGVPTEDLEHPAFMKCVEHVLKHNLVKKFFADQFEERKRVQEMIDKTPNTTPLHIEGLFKRILDVEVPDE